MRIGLLIDGPDIPAWQLQVARALADAGGEIALLAWRATPRDADSPAAATWPDRLAPLLWWFGERLDRWLANRRVRLSELESCEPIEQALPEAAHLKLFADDGSTGAAEASAREQIVRDAFSAIDLLIDLDTDRGLPDAMALPAGLRHWSLRRSAYELAPGAPRGFWEAARNDEVLELSVIDAGDDCILRQRRVAIDALSFTIGRRMCASLAAPMLVDALHDLAQGRAAGPVPALNALAVDAHPRLGQPGSLAILRALSRTLGYVARESWIRLRGLEEQWFVMLGRRRGGRYLLRDFERLEPPEGRIWADPFACIDNRPDGTRELVVFVEDMDTTVRRGQIALLRRDAQGRWHARTVIDEPHHLSYPFLFEWQGQHYMVPEAGAGNRIPLYRMGADLLQWFPEEPLMRDVRAADTSLLEHEGRVWLFTSFQRHADFGAHYRELHLFHSDSFPSQQWTAHPANPIVCDARHARMGGGFVKRDGRLYRMAQGSRAGAYGASIEMRQILRLDPQVYDEVPAGSIGPDWAPMLNGTHHLVELDEHLLIDARRLRPARRGKTQ